MKNLFDSTQVEDVKQRLLRLQPASERQWGTMNVGQTLSHCTSGFDMATGRVNVKRVPFPANIIGLLIKPLVFSNDKPIRRNSPSAPELFPADPTQCHLDRERHQLIAAIDSFAAQGPPCCSTHPHPFFGPLKPEQWAILMYKHVDHHLRQFGV
jgi:Protein of unknown function (DUF1569)